MGCCQGTPAPAGRAAAAPPPAQQQRAAASAPPPAAAPQATRNPGPTTGEGGTAATAAPAAPLSAPTPPPPPVAVEEPVVVIPEAPEPEVAVVAPLEERVFVGEDDGDDTAAAAATMQRGFSGATARFWARLELPEALVGHVDLIDADLGPSVVVLAADGTAIHRVCGVYTPLSGRRHHGQTAYVCEANALYLYQPDAAAQGSFAIAPVFGAGRPLAMRTGGSVDSPWRVWDAATQEYTAMALRVMADPAFVDPLRAAEVREERAGGDAAVVRGARRARGKWDATRRARVDEAKRARRDARAEGYYHEARRMAEDVAEARDTLAYPTPTIRVAGHPTVAGTYALVPGETVDEHVVYRGVPRGGGGGLVHLMYSARARAWLLTPRLDWGTGPVAGYYASAETTRASPVGCYWGGEVAVDSCGAPARGDDDDDDDDDTAPGGAAALLAAMQKQQDQRRARQESGASTPAPAPTATPAAAATAPEAWVDGDFPHGDAALGNTASRHLPDGGVEWVRAGAMCNAAAAAAAAAAAPTPLLLSDFTHAPANPADVLRGASGNTTLLAALANVLEHPDYLRTHVLPVAGVPARVPGRHTVHLYCPAKKDRVPIEVDEWLPCAAGSGRPAFSQPLGADLSLLLVEKALAKYAGGYTRTVGVLPARVWLMVTGCEAIESWGFGTSDAGERVATCERYGVDLIRRRPTDLRRNPFVVTTEPPRPLADPCRVGGAAEGGADAAAARTFYMYLRERLADNDLVAAFVDGPVGGVRSGLATQRGHAVLGLHRVKTTDGAVVRLVKLRAQWGAPGWAGAWADRDAASWRRLAPRGVRGLGLREAGDGVFFMAWEDFAAVFDEVQVVRCDMGAPGLVLHERERAHGIDMWGYSSDEDA